MDKYECAMMNLDKMMRKRGYMKVDECLYENDMGKVKIFFCKYSKLNIEKIKQYLQELEMANIVNAIIIYDDVITSSCKKILECMVRFTFETFTCNEMQYDLTEHILYSPHEKLSKEQVSHLGCTKKFPILLKSDAVCRYFHFQKGNVIRITRKNGIVIYRIVR